MEKTENAGSRKTEAESKKKEATKKVWTNHKGQDVPFAYISKFDKAKETLINRQIKQADAVSQRLEKFKKEAMMEMDEMIELMYKQHGMERKTDSKGNITMYNFNKSLKIEVKVQDIIDFDDRIQLAQTCINDFLTLKTQGADADLSTLVNSAFTTSKGRLDKNRVLGLFQLKIKHELWEKAMELIKESITTNNTRRYISFYKRVGDDQYKLINLNFSSL